MCGNNICEADESAVSCSTDCLGWVTMRTKRAAISLDCSSAKNIVNMPCFDIIVHPILIMRSTLFIHDAICKLRPLHAFQRAVTQAPAAAGLLLATSVSTRHFEVAITQWKTPSTGRRSRMRCMHARSLARRARTSARRTCGDGFCSARERCSGPGPGPANRDSEECEPVF